MFNILIPQGCRSDTGLSDPIIKRLQKEKWCNIKVIQLEPQNFISSYQLTDISCKANNYIGIYDQEKPRILLATGDRVEMCAAACAAFHNKIPIAHFYAGIVNDPITTFDDVDRHCITLWSDIQFCESEEAHQRTCYLLASVGLQKKLNSHVVGVSHLDDVNFDTSLIYCDKINIDETLCPREPDSITRSFPMVPYDLLLLNKEIYSYNFAGYSKCLDRMQIQIGGNPDGIVEPQEGAIYYENLPRAQFLGLLKNCQRFITNSSCAIYEAPHFIKPEQIVWVGDRNRNRARGPFQTGASDKIVTILKEYLK